MSNKEVTHRPAHSLDELLSLTDSAFIYSAYWTLLGRGCDPEGHRHFRKKLRNGASKPQLLWDLRHSAEGKARNADLPGLNRLLERYASTRWPVVGPLFARFYGLESASAGAVQRRRLRHLIEAVEYELDERIERLERSVDHLRDEIGHRERYDGELEARITDLERGMSNQGATAPQRQMPPAAPGTVMTARARHLLALLNGAIAGRA